MITDERIRDYIHSLESGQGEPLDSIAGKARERDIPIIKKET